MTDVEHAPSTDARSFADRCALPSIGRLSRRAIVAAVRTLLARVRSSGRGSQAVLAALLAVFAVTPALAQAPVDVPEEAPHERALPLPSAPAGFRHERAAGVRWDYPSEATAIVRDLQETHRREWPRLAEQLGSGPLPGALTVRIGRHPDEMAELAPVGAPPPAYASGVAYPARGLILLTLAAPESWERPDIESVFVHELSHVALHRAVDGHPVPRWFSEGVAIHQSGERSFDRVQTLWTATVAGRLIALDRLSNAFSARPHQVSLAYAQAADFVRWLRARRDGDERFRELISRLRSGQSIDTAFDRTYSVSLVDLELQWHENLAERFQAWPLLFGSGGLWVLAAVLIVIAYVRRKRRDKERLAQWEAEERAALAAAHLLASSRPSTDLPAPRRADDEREVLYVIPPEPRFRDSGVPTIEHEGRSHTLH